MNFEQLSDIILENQTIIKKNIFLKKKIKIFINNYFYSLNLKLKKLKLGLVHFEIKQFFFANIFLYDIIEMRYVRQDTTEEDDLKPEKKLEAIKWKWDFQNVAALLILTSLTWFVLKIHIDSAFKDLFYSFYQTEKFDTLSIYALQTSFKNETVSTLSYFKTINEIFVKSLLSCSIQFKFL